ncbi:transmembrane protein [Thalictrum thalictroides]|uniref:Transmembrane protein n=1 Tax=Thalictrum thalictroides TaxID=46969 RepID=A0A7J6W3H3_THATH|nr:transmembrane protein [Thalictrum thalictroides]
MDTSKGVGFMAVFAVSGSVVLLSLQLHKRLLSDFMKKVESELGGVEKVSPKRKVRFAEDVVEPSSNNKAYRLRHSVRLGAICDQSVTVKDKMKCNLPMPPNRRALYEGVLRYRALKGHTALHCC